MRIWPSAGTSVAVPDHEIAYVRRDGEQRLAIVMVRDGEASERTSHPPRHDDEESQRKHLEQHSKFIYIHDIYGAFQYWVNPRWADWIDRGPCESWRLHFRAPITWCIDMATPFRNSLLAAMLRLEADDLAKAAT